MTSFDDQANCEPKTVSRLALGCLVLVIIIPLTLVEVFVAVTVLGKFSTRFGCGWIGGFALPNLILSRVAADRILKRCGLSRSGKTLEVQGRTVVLPDGEVANDEVVELRYPAKSLTQLGVMCLVFAFAMALMIGAMPRDQTALIVCGYALIAFMALGGVYCLYLRWGGKPQAWADALGVTAYPVGPHISRKFVPWSEVATCEIETYYDTFGKPVIVQPILKRGDGEVLMKLNLSLTSVEDQERLVKYIKAKLPKSKLDLWD